MSKVEDFSAELVSPELFREICSITASVGSRCVISTRIPNNHEDDQPEQTETLDQEELAIGAINFQNTFQLWTHLSSLEMFNGFRITNPESIELNSHSLANAFKYEAGVISSTEIRMKISHKQKRLSGTSVELSEDSSVVKSRLISFLMSTRQVDGIPTKAIEQRISAEYVEPEAAWEEPSLQGISDWADPNVEQLGQMAKVCDQYKKMSDKILVVISKSGKMTLKVESNEVNARTSWHVEKAERVDESQSASQETNNEQEEPEDSIFIDEEINEGSSAATNGTKNRDEHKCFVLAKDWQTVLQARRMCRRIVMGILHERGLVAYGFLRQGRNYSNQNVATFYLWHQN